MSDKILTLTTDFGTRDGYIGGIKGLILSRDPAVKIVDLSHEISPFNIGEAAYAVYNAHSFFPDKTVHVVIVDPGVGSERRILLVEASGQHFIGPDNGVFDPIVYLNEKYRCMEIDPGYFSHVSATFHGRDIFVPAALKILNAESIKEFTKEIEYEYRLLTPEMMEGSQAVVLHSDHFGNIVTALSQEKTDPGDLEGLRFEQIDIPFISIYEEGGEASPSCLFGSNGLLEVAIKRGSAADYFKKRWNGIPTSFDVVWK